MIITIDGPAGAGKTTIAKNLAKKIKFLHVNSGMIYRTMTYFGLKKYGSDLPHKTEQVAKAFMVDPDKMVFGWKHHQNFVELDGKPLTFELSDKRITDMVGHVANDPRCREVVNEKLSRLAIEKDLIVDGRDIGSKIFPWAELKLFLDATIEERAQRRAQEIGIKTDSERYLSLMKDIQKRDHDDRNRTIAPLVIPKDAIYVNTTGKNLEEVLDEIIRVGGLKIT